MYFTATKCLTLYIKLFCQPVKCHIKISIAPYYSDQFCMYGSTEKKWWW